MTEAAVAYRPMTLNQFLATHDGQMRIASQEPFCVGGMLYQAYKGAIPDIHERQLTDEEIAAVHDEDGTLHVVLTNRKNRLDSRSFRKAKEYRVRDETKRKQRLADLELAKLEKELGLAIGEEIYGVTTDEKPEPMGYCDICNEPAPEGHKNPIAWVRGHKVGQHRK